VTRNGATRTAVWVVAAPSLLALGILVGSLLPIPRATGNGIWTDGDRGARNGDPRAPHLPSLAPLVRAVRGGVVGIHAYRDPVDADVAAAVHDDGSDSDVSDFDASAIGPDRGEVALRGDDAGSSLHGTGFVIHADGLVVTNHHLIAGAQRIVVEVPGFAPCAAEVRGVDSATDLAVLRIVAPPANLTVLPLSDSAPIEQGDWVVAVGNPFEFHQSVTLGIVSYVGRHLPEEGLMVTNEYLQFSAPVNPGSSGGPLLNLHGEVVGVTTRMHASGQGISFAVPTKTLKWVLSSMDRNAGVVARGFLGIRFQPMPRAADGSESAGAIVMDVQVDKPAHRAGLREGDVIVTFDGRPVVSAYDLHDWITQSTPGSRVQIRYRRNGVVAPGCEVELGGLPFGTSAKSDVAATPARHG
jgi:serine protease Do